MESEISNYWSKRRAFVAGLSLTGACLLLLFQNFTSIPLSDLKPKFEIVEARVTPASDGSVDIRDLAPHRREIRQREGLVAPQAGHDLNSIGQDWMIRQTHLLTGGAEKEILESLNKRVNRMFKFEDVESEDWPDGQSGESGDRKPSSEEETEAAEAENAFLPRPKAVKFTAVNRVQMDFDNNTQVTCSFQGSSMQWDFVRPISRTLDLNLRHESSDSKSSVLINYSW